MARQIKMPTERSQLGRVLAAPDGDAPDAPLGTGLEPNTGGRSQAMVGADKRPASSVKLGVRREHAGPGHPGGEPLRRRRQGGDRGRERRDRHNRRLRAAQGPYRQGEFDALIEAWLPLTYAVNSLNHGMGQPDLYPFVLAPTVIGKLRFVHGLIHGSSG